jgi:hypothetical protein
VTFRAAWPTRIEIETSIGTIHAIGLQKLLENTRATGRPEDQRDVEKLEQITRAASRNRRTRRRPAATSSRTRGTPRR